MVSPIVWQGLIHVHFAAFWRVICTGKYFYLLLLCCKWCRSNTLLLLPLAARTCSHQFGWIAFHPLPKAERRTPIGPNLCDEFITNPGYFIDETPFCHRLCCWWLGRSHHRCSLCWEGLSCGNLKLLVCFWDTIRHMIFFFGPIDFKGIRSEFA